MFFGYETRPAVLPADIKVKREVKSVCSRDRKCRGSMSARSIINLFNAGHIADISAIRTTEDSLEKEVYLYWDGTVDYGIKSYKCTAEYRGHTYCWYEDQPQIGVIRTDTGHICAKGKWYTLSDLVNTVFELVKASGSGNPAFDMPSWFYTGSPYADEIEKIGCKQVPEPATYRVEVVPKLGKVWRARDPMWPTIFNCEVKDV